MGKRIVIIGGGGHAKVVISIVSKLPEYEIVGYVDDVDCGSKLGVQYLGTDKCLNSLYLTGEVKLAALGIGSIKEQSHRKKIVEKIKSMGLSFPAIISPDAIVDSSVKVSEGALIAPAAVINCDSKIGDFAIINTRASIDHDCVIGSFTHVAPGCSLSGGVRVENECQIGTGATVIQGKTICSNTVVGAGAVVIESISVAGTYVGVPAQRKTK